MENSSSIGVKMVQFSNENPVRAREVLAIGPQPVPIIETALITLAHLSLQSEDIEVEVCFDLTSFYFEIRVYVSYWFAYPTEFSWIGLCDKRIGLIFDVYNMYCIQFALNLYNRVMPFISDVAVCIHDFHCCCYRTFSAVFLTTNKLFTLVHAHVLCFLFSCYFHFRELTYALFDSVSKRLNYASRSKVSSMSLLLLCWVLWAC